MTYALLMYTYIYIYIYVYLWFLKIIIMKKKMHEHKHHSDLVCACFNVCADELRCSVVIGLIGYKCLLHVCCVLWHAGLFPTWRAA